MLNLNNMDDINELPAVLMKTIREINEFRSLEKSQEKLSLAYAY